MGGVEGCSSLPGLLAFGSRERGTPGRVRTHIHVGHGLTGHAEVTKMVLLNRVVLVGLQELLQ